MSLAEYEAFVFGAGHLDDARPGRALARPVRAAGAVIDRLAPVSRAADRGGGHRSGGRRRRPHVDQRRRPRELPRRRGLHQPGTRLATRATSASASTPPTTAASSAASGCGSRTAASSARGQRAAREFLQGCWTWTTARATWARSRSALNDEIHGFTRNVVFDEKIGGTCTSRWARLPREPAAPTGPALHWDMVCDLRSGRRGLRRRRADRARRAVPVSDRRVESLARCVVELLAAVEPGQLMLIEAPALAEPLVLEMVKRRWRRARCRGCGWRRRARAGIPVGGQRGAAATLLPRALPEMEPRSTRGSRSTPPGTPASCPVSTRPGGRPSGCRGRRPWRRYMQPPARRRAALVRHRLPLPGVRPGRRHVPGRVRGLRLPRRLADLPDPVAAWRTFAEQLAAAGRPAVRRATTTAWWPPTTPTSASASPAGGGSTATATKTSPTARSSPARSRRGQRRRQLLASPPSTAAARSTDVRLTFKDGKVVEPRGDARARTSCSQMLDMDAGARFLGEFAIGTNYDITRFTQKHPVRREDRRHRPLRARRRLPRDRQHQPSACTGTWSATCAAAARSTPTAS